MTMALLLLRLLVVVLLLAAMVMMVGPGHWVDCAAGGVWLCLCAEEACLCWGGWEDGGGMERAERRVIMEMPVLIVHFCFPVALK